MRAPAFQFYPADYLADMRIRMLSWASRGLYIDLLCYCWREGWIPSDSSAIAQLCNCHDTATIEPCLALFSSHPDDAGKLIHAGLDAEREKQKAFREERKASGIKGAAKRWGGSSSAIKQPMAKNGSSVFCLQSADKLPTTPKREKFRGTLEELKSFAAEIGLPESDGEWAFYKWEGNGWQNNGKAMKDWKMTMRSWKACNNIMPSHRNAGTLRKPSNRAENFSV